MGLLDLANDPMMGLAGGLLGGGNFGQALTRGLTASQAMQMAEQERKLRESQALENKARAQHYQDQITTQRNSQQATAQRDAQFMEALQKGLPPQQIAQLFPEKIDTIKKIAESPNYGRSAVARTVDVEGPSGKLVRQLDQYGEPVGQDMAGYVAPQLINQGDRQTFAKPVAGQSFGVGMSPSELDASARGWASNGLARERLAFEQQGGAEGGKPQWNSELGGFVDPKTRVVMPAIDPQGNPIVNKGGKLTEGEAKGTLFLSQMKDASKVLNEIGDGASPLMVAATGSPYTNWMAGDTSQKTGQARSQWAEAYLRMKTGAAATAGEVENNIRTFFPVVGDSPATIKQKNTARAEAEKAMEVPAGRGAARLEPSAVKPAPPQQAVNMLRMNPRLAADFDSKYGAGLAAQILGR